MKTIIALAIVSLALSATALPTYAQQTTNTNGGTVNGLGGAGNQDNRYDRHPSALDFYAISQIKGGRSHM